MGSILLGVGAPPSMCVSLGGEVKELFIWNSRSELHGEAPRLLLNKGWPLTEFPPPNFLSSLHLTHPFSSFKQTGFYLFFSITLFPFTLHKQHKLDFSF